MILRGDARHIPLADETVQCCVTSPPYWGLRDYGLGDGGIGLEPTLDEYVANIVQVFREVWRVLRPDGTLWLNLGDCYGSGTRASRDYSKTTKHGYWNNPGIDKRNPSPAKQLLGLPWRVAFALQAPWHSGPIKDERDRLWLAGLTDGEGCLTILETTSPHGSGNSYPPVFQVRMTDVRPIERCAEITGYGNASPPQEPPSQPGQRPSFQWRLNGRKAADVAAEVYPYLLVKKKQAIILWNHQAVRDSYEVKKGSPIPPVALEKQRLCRDLAQRLNAGEEVDLPSWMIEPPRLETPGWYLRSDCIWAKPNPMPESVRDRPTRSHEYLFLLTKQARYYYDAEAIKEESVTADMRRPYAPGQVDKRGNGHDRGGGELRKQDALGKNTYTGFNGRYEHDQAAGRNRRTVWTIPTQPYRGAHFATYPEKLVEPCILAGSRPGDIILDPFCGSGTTGAVAKRLGRDFVGLDMSAGYLKLAQERIGAVMMGMALA